MIRRIYGPRVKELASFIALFGLAACGSSQGDVDPGSGPSPDADAGAMETSAPAPEVDARAIVETGVAEPTNDAGARADARQDARDASVDAPRPPSPDAADAVVDAARPGWTLVWNDEFEGPSGTAVDTTKWNLVNKGDGFGNNELEFYTNRTANASLDGNGFLVIKTMQEAYMGRNYTSARLESAGKFERMFGRFEARVKMPAGQGIWPAFWALGNNIGTVSWPACGEIDIMENIGREPSVNHGSLHGPGYSGGNPLSATYTLPNQARFSDAYHVFAVEWEDGVVRFYVDDNLYETRTRASVPAGGTWVYDHPFYLILNVAVGGAFPGSPDSTTVFPQTMSVDYVRVYSH
jgi:beta-glucanase (GH16 family)